MSVLTSNVQFNVTSSKGQMSYTEVSFTYRGRSYVAEVQHNNYNDAAIISDIHNPSNFNALKTPKKQDIERELIEEYRIHISNKQSTITVGSISKFSVVGSREVESEAAGKFTLYNVEFEYNGLVYNGQVIKTVQGVITFTYMHMKGSKGRSTLATMDKVRHEVRQAFELSQLSEATAGHEELTVVKEDTMQLTSPQEQAAQVDDIVARFVKSTGLAIEEMFDVNGSKVTFMTDGIMHCKFDVTELTEYHRTFYKLVREKFTRKYVTENIMQRIDAIHRMLWNTGYDTSTYARMESLTVKYFDEYRFITMNEIFFLSDVEILQYVEKLFRSGGDA